MSFADIPQTIATAINTALGDVFAEAVRIDGAPSLADLQRLTRRSPSLFVHTPSDKSRGKIAGKADIMVTFEAWVFVQARASEQRGRAILALRHAVRLYLATVAQTWGGLASSRPEDVDSRTVYSKDLDQHGAALALVTWRQRFMFADLEPTLVDLEHINFLFDVEVEGAESPDPGPSVEFNTYPETS